MQHSLPIFFACDDNYVPFLAVALESLEKNASRRYHYLIKILHDHAISENNQQKIIAKYHYDVFDIEFVDIAETVKNFRNQLHVRDYYSKSTYYRLFIADLYPQFDKALYLDSDIVILGDISKLFNTPLDFNLVGAIPDESVQLIDEFKEYVVNRIGVKTPRHYFNAGILLMNLDCLREVNFAEMFLELINKVTFDVAQDQDYLNAICRNRVKYIAPVWNKMPFPSKIKEKNIKLIHYNLDKKPWQSDGIMYEKYFWEYAQMTEYYDAIKIYKSKYTDAQRAKAAAQTVQLIQKTHEQALETEENQRIAKILNALCFAPMVKDKGGRMRLDINILKEDAKELAAYNKIMLDDEKHRRFDHDQDVVNPDTYLPLDEDFPYIRKGIRWWGRQKFFNMILRHYTKKINKELTNVQVVGRENVKGVKGAIVTCNHISKVDNFAVRAVFRRSIMYVASEHNNWKGFMGVLARNTGYIPLPLNMKYSFMRKFNKAIEFYLRKKKKILFYPEQAMWREYKKPRPLRNGAFHYAAINNVPVIPMFITIVDKSEPVDAYGRANFGDYTIHVLPPIYPDSNLSIKENEENMKNANFDAWQKVYEKTYGVKLKYDQD